MLRNMLFYQNILTASRNLSDKMMSRLLRATLAFFDKTPIGTILARLSKDVAMADDFLTWMFMDMM
jgi:ABC-type multidrug transport system fused ATPase/permease subunit